MTRRKYTRRTPRKKKNLSIERVFGCDHCGKLFPVIRPGIKVPGTDEEMRYTYGRIIWSGFSARANGLSVLIPGDRLNSKPTDRVLFFCDDTCKEAFV